MGITRQAYYQAEKRAQMTAQATEQILELVMEYRCLMPSIGTRKLYWLIKGKLLQRGLKCGRDQLFKILKEHNLLIRPKRRYTKTTDSKHWMKKHPNLLKDYSAVQANEVFVSDITYVESAEGVHYSDRGLQYCSYDYQTMLGENNIQTSMTDGYDCYQNALAERINGILKQEFLTTRCQTMKELDHLITESIMIYNYYRPHLSLNMNTPNQMYEQTKTELIA